MRYGARVQELRSKLQGEGLGSFLVCSPSSVRYLSGFSGSTGWLWVSSEEVLLLTDFRYKERAAREAPGCELHIVKDRLADGLAEIAVQRAVESVGFDSASLTYKDYARLEDRLGDVQLRPIERMVETLREVKDEEEMARIRQAVRITDKVFDETLPLVKPGALERDIAAEIEYKLKRGGGQRPAFDAIVASGPNGSMPHAATSDRKIATGDLVTLDMGTYFNGYASDLTRTVVVGTPTVRQKEIYGLVLAAQQKAISSARAGMPASQLDAVARQFIGSAGFGDCFGHGLGHGVGLEVHDSPRVSWTNPDPLKAGMVVTIEPGVYIPGWGGVRIEDVVIVQEGGCEDITLAPKQLISV